MAGQNEIKTTITLDGTKQVERDLRSIGKTAEQTGRQVGQALDGGKIGSGFSASMSGLQRSLKSVGANMQASAKLASSGIKDIANGLSQIRTFAANAATKVTLIGAAFAGAAVAAGKLASSAADTAESIQNQATAFDVTFQKMQMLRDAMRETGADEALLEKSILKLGNFKQFEEFALSINRMTDGQQQLNAVIDTFGKKGAVQLLAFFRSYADSLDTGRQKTLKLIPPLDQIAQTNLADLDTASDRMFTNFDRLRLLVGAKLAPTFTRLFDAVRRFTGDWGPLFARAFGSIADAINIRFKRNGTDIKKWFDDLSAWTIGVMGDIALIIAGADDKNIKNKWLLDIRDGAEKVYRVLKLIFGTFLPEAFRVIGEKAQWVADKINGIFGTGFTKEGIIATLAIIYFTRAFTLLSAALGIATGALKGFRAVAVLVGTTPLDMALQTAGIIGFAKAVDDAKQKLKDLTGQDIPTASLAMASANPPVGGTIFAFTYWDELRNKAREFFGLPAGGGLRQGWTDASNWIRDQFNAALEAIKPKAVEVYDYLVAKFTEFGSWVGGVWDGATAYFKDVWKTSINWVGKRFDSMIQSIKRSIRSIGEMISNAGTTTQGGGSGYASGGHVTGPGTGTSDSILARLSNGEYVINAKSAGLLGRRFLDAINGIRSSSVLRNGLPGFATGGFVGTPNFAIAGSSGRPVNLTIGGESFSMNAADDVAERLVKFAGRAKVRSAGRKPAWYGA